MTLSHMDMHVQGTIMKTRTTPHHRSHTRCMAPGRVNIVDVHSEGCVDSRTRGRKPSCHKFLLTYPNEIMDGNMVGDGLKNNRLCNLPDHCPMRYTAARPYILPEDVNNGAVGLANTRIYNGYAQ